MPATTSPVESTPLHDEVLRLRRDNASVTDALRSLEALSVSDTSPAADPAETCHVLVGKLRDTIQTYALGVFLTNQTTLEFDLAMVLPAALKERILDEFEKQLEQGAIGYAVRERRPVVTSPLAGHPDTDEANCVIVLPVSTPRETHALVLGLSPTRQEHVHRNTRRLLNIVANHVAVSMENASLLERLDEQTRSREQIIVKRAAQVLARQAGLEETCEKLRRASAAKDDLLSLVGHELRTPLTSILSLSEFLTQEGLSPEEILEMGGSIQREATRLNQLVTELLELARSEAGKLSYTYAESNLNEVAALCAAGMDAAARTRQIRLFLRKDETIPSIRFAPDRVQQVIMNMLGNAIKFSQDGGKILITTENREDEVYLSVQDFGIGIAARDIPKVFNKFERIEHNAACPKGTGLGMPLSKNIIEDGHGGRMWVSSEGRGRGTTFFFSLPKRREDPG